jgi:hypothetical protein
MFRRQLVESKLTLTFPFDFHLKWCSTTNCLSNLLLHLHLLLLWRCKIRALALPFCLAIEYRLVLSRRFSRNARILTGLLAIEYHLVLLRRPSGYARTLTGSCCNSVSPRALTVSLRQRSHSHEQCSIDDQAAIIVGLPLLLNRHCCRAAIVALFPRATSEHPICHWATTSSLYSLGLPSNAPFVVVIRLPLSSCSLSCDNLSAYLADPHCLYICLVCCLRLSPCSPSTVDCVNPKI